MIIRALTLAIGIIIGMAAMAIITQTIERNWLLANYKIVANQCVKISQQQDAILRQVIEGR